MPVSNIGETKQKVAAKPAAKGKTQAAAKGTDLILDEPTPRAEKVKKAKPEKVKPVDMPTTQMPDKQVVSYFGNEVHELPLSQLVFITDETHPAYEPERLKLPVNKDLAASLGTDGQVQPGHVYPIGDGRYFVLSGMQRVKALRHLQETEGGTQKFRSFVADPELGDLGATAVSVISNEFAAQRTNEGRALVMRRSLQVLGYFNPSTTADQKTAYVKTVAGFFGVNKQTVRNALVIMERVTPAVRAAVNEGIIKETVAVRLAAKPKDEQDKAINAARSALKRQEAESTKNADGSVSKKAGKITEGKLLNARPSVALLRELFGQPGVPKDASNLLQYVVGDLDLSGAQALMPWLRKALEKCENAVF